MKFVQLEQISSIQTDRQRNMTKLIVAFRKFCKRAPKNEHKNQVK